METWVFILLLAVFNSFFGAVYSLINLKWFAKGRAVERSISELNIMSGEATFGDYTGIFIVSFFVGIFTLRNLLFSPFSLLIIYIIK